MLAPRSPAGSRSGGPADAASRFPSPADPAALTTLSADLPAGDDHRRRLRRHAAAAEFDAALPAELAPALARRPAALPARVGAALELLPGRDSLVLYRDWLRVLLLTLLLPWSPLLWRRACPTLAAAHANAACSRHFALAPGGTVLVATYGVRFIVAPLLARHGTAPGRSRSARPSSPATGCAASARPPPCSRRSAPTRCAAASSSPTARTTATSCRSAAARICCPPSLRPSRRRPATCRCNTCMHCKRQGENVILRTILFYDLFCLFLAYVPASEPPMLCALGLLLFQLAFWTIYEIGNWENDCLGQRYEDAAARAAGLRPLVPPHAPAPGLGMGVRRSPRSPPLVSPPIWPPRPPLFVGLDRSTWRPPGSATRCTTASIQSPALFVYPLMQAGKGVGLAAVPARGARRLPAARLRAAGPPAPLRRLPLRRNPRSARSPVNLYILPASSSSALSCPPWRRSPRHRSG